MSLALLDLILLRTKTGTGYPVKGSSLTWTEEDTNFQILADCLRDIAAISASSGFEPYDNGVTYSDTRPDHVSYNNNIYEYISPTPQAGITPGSNPLVWEIVSLGSFAHIQNTDQYLDQGGPFQVSAEDIYNLLTTPPGDALTQGTNTLTEPLNIFADGFEILLSSGANAGATPRVKLLVTPTGIGIAYEDVDDSANNSSITATSKILVTQGVLQMNEAIEMQGYHILWKGTKNEPAAGDIREGYGLDPVSGDPAIILEKYDGADWIFSSSRIV